MVDARDLYTRGHSDRVSYYACRIAEKMGKDERFINRIRVAGLFHDIGKIAVPDSVLLKNASLTREEYEIIKRHPGLGYHIPVSYTHLDVYKRQAAGHAEGFGSAVGLLPCYQRYRPGGEF